MTKIRVSKAITAHFAPPTNTLRDVWRTVQSGLGLKMLRTRAIKYPQQATGNQITGAGYKIYLLNNGLLMFLLMIGFYILLINPKSNKRYAISFIVFVLLCFLQRGYLSWYSWLLSYTVGIGATRMINPYKKMQRIEREEAEIEETKDNNEIA